MSIFPTAIREFLCHTGTRSLVRSRAVSDHRAIVRNFGEMLLDFVSGHPNRARQFLVRLRPRYRIARINKSERLAPIHPFADLVDCNSCSFHNV